MEKPSIEGGKPIREKKLPFYLHTIDKEEIDEVVDTLKSEWITVGPKTHKFENNFKNYINCKHAIATNSCTAGLHLSLVASGIKDEDEIITTSFTFASTVNTILHQRAKPVFVDIKENTYDIDSDKIEAVISNKTKAILPVHYGGQPCDMDSIMKIAKKHNLLVLEDAAHAIGAEYKGKRIGTIGDVTSFSFYATKNITTGDGGMITTNNDSLAEKMRILSLHGISKDAWKRYSSKGSWYYEILYPGYKYNMTDIQASLGLCQLGKIDKFLKAREIIAKKYTSAFEGIPEIIEPYVKNDVKHAWHLYQIQIDIDALKINRNQFIDVLNKENIGVSVHFIPIHLHPYYREKFGFKLGDFPVTEHVYNRIISLPIYPRMTERDVEDVINAVKKIVEYYKK